MRADFFSGEEQRHFDIILRDVAVEYGEPQHGVSFDERESCLPPAVVVKSFSLQANSIYRLLRLCWELQHGDGRPRRVRVVVRPSSEKNGYRDFEFYRVEITLSQESLQELPFRASRDSVTRS